MFDEEDEDSHLSHKERMMKELHSRRTDEELNVILVQALDRLHNKIQEV
jgi:hypothetical protein